MLFLPLSQLPIDPLSVKPKFGFKFGWNSNYYPIHIVKMNRFHSQINNPQFETKNPSMGGKPNGMESTWAAEGRIWGRTSRRLPRPGSGQATGAAAAATPVLRAGWVLWCKSRWPASGGRWGPAPATASCRVGEIAYTAGTRIGSTTNAQQPDGVDSAPPPSRPLAAPERGSVLSWTATKQVVH